LFPNTKGINKKADVTPKGKGKDVAPKDDPKKASIPEKKGATPKGKQGGKKKKADLP